MSTKNNLAVDLECPFSTPAIAQHRVSKPPPFAALLRLHVTYLWRHRRRLSLAAPQRFTELVQHRKLVDRDPRIPHLIDKLAVKAFVADQLGADWITPTLWSGQALPETPPCATPFVVKSRHGCGQMRVVRDTRYDWDAIRRTGASWMRRPYGEWLDEWGYRDVPRGLLIEPFVGTGPALPIDYKLYVFHGRVEAIQVHLDRAHAHHWALYDRSWHRMSAQITQIAPMPPPSLARMIAGAETLGATFDFVRVDCYDINGAPRFGEMTFYPGSGLDTFDPPELDVMLGRLWTARGVGIPAIGQSWESSTTTRGPLG